MRKMILMLGTLLITITILISGSVVAPYVIDVTDHANCTNIDEIRYIYDTVYASLGDYSGYVLGWAVLDLGSGGAMGPSTNFIVYATSPAEEVYNISVAETPEDDGWYLGSGIDTQNETFTTPSDPGRSWRYIIIRGWTGLPEQTGDYGYGPDIDAIGY
jgi:hypothetical protein